MDKIDINTKDIDTIFNIPLLKRQYTRINERDIWNINNGRCPDYALGWSIEQNKLYWPENHNFFKGYEKTIKDNYDEIDYEKYEEIQEDKKKDNIYYKLFRQITTKFYEKNYEQNNKIILFCSLEVLVCNIDDNINELNLSNSGKKLWEIITIINPIIVINNKYFTPEIIKWCELNLNTSNITLYSTIIEEEENLKSYILIDYQKNENYKYQKFIQYTTIFEILNNLLINI